MESRSGQDSGKMGAERTISGELVWDKEALRDTASPHSQILKQDIKAAAVSGASGACGRGLHGACV